MNNTHLIETLLANLNSGEADFSYRKGDGSPRKARGTTKVELIPEAARAVKDQVVTAETTAISYYDLESKGWRSFRKDQLISA